MTVAAVYDRRLEFGRLGKTGFSVEIVQKAFFPSSEEGRPRRYNNATLPHKIGAAGEVRPIPVSYRLPDCFKNRLDVLMNDSILESNEFYSQSLQKCRTFRLVLCSEFSKMGRTIQFDSNVAVDAEKVDNIATDAVLPAELFPKDLPPLKVLP